MMTITTEKEYWERQKHYKKRIYKLTPLIITDIKKFFSNFEAIFKEAEKEGVFPSGTGEKQMLKLTKGVNTAPNVALWSKKQKDKFIKSVKKGFKLK